MDNKISAASTQQHAKVREGCNLMREEITTVKQFKSYKGKKDIRKAWEVVAEHFGVSRNTAFIYYKELLLKEDEEK